MVAAADKQSENIFKIMDEIVRQLNRTKKMFILMIVSIIVVVPVTHIVANILVGDTFRGSGGPPFDRDGPPGGGPIPGAIVAGVVIAWIVIGIRQWLILNKWTRKYETYKELQRKIDEKLDFEKEDEDEGEKKSSSGND